MTRLYTFCIGCLMATLIMVSASQAADDFWKSPVSGVWQNGSNWLDGTVPGASDDVKFQSCCGAPYTVTFNGTPPTINSLLVGVNNPITFTSIGILAGQISTLHVELTSTFIPSATVLIQSVNLTLGTSGGIFNPDKPLHLTTTRNLNVESGATLNVRFGSHVDVATSVLIVGDSQINVTGSGSTMDANIHVASGSLNITAGGLVQSDSSQISSGGQDVATATISGASSQWIISNQLNVGLSFAGSNGSVTVGEGGLVEIGGVLEIETTGTLTIDGGHIVTPSLDNSRGGTLNFLAGMLTISSSVEIGGNAFPMGLTLGPQQQVITPLATTIAPLRTLKLDGGTLTTNGLVVNGALQFNSGMLELTGGTITGLTALTIPTNGELRASGIQALRITGLAGSTITATGNLTLGDASAVNGFGTQGTVQVGANTLTLLDTNDVVFDSLALATLGSGASPGTLSAANGLTLDFGGNMTGFGTVSTPNNAVKPLINNGHITGNSAAQPITLPGYVKGVGTLDNVNLTGTFSPGLSPTTSMVGNLAFSPTSTLIMEIGGASAGSQYDQLIASGNLLFDGTLQVSLINSFAPSLGNTFNVFDWQSASGTFDTINLPALGGSLAWDTSQLYIDGTLRIASADLPGDFNHDGAVDAADYVAWRKNDGTQLGYDAWRANFGRTAGSGSGANLLAAGDSPAANFAVPEPRAQLLICSSLAVGLTLRRRHVKRFV